MDRKINFSTEATKRTEEIIRYLSEEWSVSAALNFTNKLNDKIRNIQLFPRSYTQVEDKTDLRSCVITSQITFFTTGLKKMK